MSQHSEFDALVQTISALRAPDGCPWDRKQTHRSIARNLIEETYEAVDAIESDNVQHLREELGDVLMQVVLQSQIAQEAGEFTIDDVCRDINQKLIRRHPHVFGDAKAATPEEVSELWSQVKLQEKREKAQAQGLVPADGGENDPNLDAAERENDSNPYVSAGRQGLLDDIPRALPALMAAQKISRKAVAAGFEWESVDGVWDKVHEEVGEFRAATTPQERELEFGDILFALVNVARWEGVDAEGALRAVNEKFRRRWSFMEGAAWARGLEIDELTTDEQEELWRQAKQLEHRI